MYPRIAILPLLLATACGSSSDAEPAPDARTVLAADARVDIDADTGPTTVFGGDRPVTLGVPTSYSADTPAPLVIALHGFFTNPDYIVGLLGIETWYEDKGFLFLAPDGLADADGNYHWNATPACCDFYDKGTDDVAYLAGLIRDVSAVYNVDPKRTYVIGHSNGGFMAHRLACDHADKIAGIISFAGAGFDTTADCAPSEPVSVLQLHGTTDTTISYDGGMLTQKDGTNVPYPSAATTVANWAGYNRCEATTTEAAPLDVTTTDGSETAVAKHTGCPAGIDAELWTMPNLGHVVLFAPVAKDAFWQWFQNHPKP